MQLSTGLLLLCSIAMVGSAAAERPSPQAQWNSVDDRGFRPRPTRRNDWGDNGGAWGSVRRRRTALGAHVAAPPVILSLVNDKTGAQFEWPTEGYDVPTVNMALFCNGMLVVCLIVTNVFIYHWSREDTQSSPSLHGARDAKFQIRESKALHAALPPVEEEECASWGDATAEAVPPPVTSIQVPPDKAHTPAAQAIAGLQKDLKRYNKQEEKSPAAWRRVKIKELEERLRGAANSQGWLVDSANSDVRASTCKPCNADVETGEPEQVHPPGLKACCMSWCGYCPCTYCQDSYELDNAKHDLAELQADMATQREDVVKMYMKKKGMSEAAANDAVDKKIAAAEQKVKDEQEKLQGVAQEKGTQAIGFCQTAVVTPCAMGFWSWPAFIGLGTAGAGAAGQNTLGGDLSLSITLLVFPLTMFALYYKAADRRGLRPLLMYVPGGMMMLNYCVWNSIQEREKAQMYLFDSTRVKNFTKYLEIIGIIITIVANLWNASVDKTVWSYLKEKGWLGYLERKQESFTKSCLCCFSSPSEEEGEVDVDMEAASDASSRVAEASTVAPKTRKVSGLVGMHGTSDE